jgi:hypothetical protein
MACEISFAPLAKKTDTLLFRTKPKIARQGSSTILKKATFIIRRIFKAM